MPTGIYKRDSVEERFWNRVNKNGGTQSHAKYLGSCWIWKGSVFKTGYGAIRSNGETQYTHRVAWEIKNGSIPNNLWVLHRCDNRRCVRVSHLFLGTAAENNLDCINKGRARSGQFYLNKIHCKNGHSYDGRNKRQRTCRTCTNDYARKYREAKRKK